MNTEIVHGQRRRMRAFYIEKFSKLIDSTK